MKNKLKNLIMFIIILIITVFFLYYYNVERYRINSPMADIEYKRSIIRDSHNPFYKLENLRSVVGETELIEFIKSNDNNPEIYSPSKKNITNGTFRANLHMHTLNSDGIASVEQRLDAAQRYAENKFPNGYMYIAITDHNTVLGAKEVVKILQKYPKRFKNVKVILGMEVYTAFKSRYYDKPVQVHVLTWCLNPYDKFLNKEFFKADLNDKWNRGKKDRDFDYIIPVMSKYAIPGIAHPIRYTNRLGEKKFLYMEEMFDSYSKLSTKPLFAEVYYQVYPRYYPAEFYKTTIIPYQKFVNEKAQKYGITRTGSTDSHSMIIFD